MKIIKREGNLVDYDINKITQVIVSAINNPSVTIDNKNTTPEYISTIVNNKILHLGKDKLHIEEIQDIVENTSMDLGEHSLAKAFILYRKDKANKRNIDTVVIQYKHGEITTQVTRKDLCVYIDKMCEGYVDTNTEELCEDIIRNSYNGMTIREYTESIIMVVKSHIEKVPDYTYVASNLLLSNLISEACGYLGLSSMANEPDKFCYDDYFPTYIKKGVELELISDKLLGFDLKLLSGELITKNDKHTTYLSLQTLYDRYFIHSYNVKIELPQAFYMRVAMGLSINEADKNNKAIEFYKLLSSHNFMSSTPTLFNSGTLHTQLSSCFLTTVPDDLKGIFKAYQDDAMLSKYSGGLGNDWTQVRSMGSRIKGTNGESQGIIPFLKIANDTAIAVNQGGKRKGAICAYLETWHLDIEEFLDLRKNTGDDRRRTHDMNTANWVPDLFMERVINKGEWTLFSPDEVSDLHDLYGNEFTKRYVEYETLADQGLIKKFKKVEAVELWRKMLGMVFETGHPWIVFKDPCNLRSPQKHTGVVHSSNLCTEITLNTSEEEVAVCNLGSINLPKYINKDTKTIDESMLERDIITAIRMLDNVIDINLYPIKEAETSNKRHRPIGLGMMGFQDVLYILDIPYESEEAVEIADKLTYLVSYYTILASSKLAEERGSYSTFEGSDWSKGILPVDTIKYLNNNRNIECLQDSSTSIVWEDVSEIVRTKGMRNSNCLAIAPTATIANICNVTQSIEPTYQNMYVKSNMSGEFTVINQYLVSKLRELGMWDNQMIHDLKLMDGSVQNIDRVPQHVKDVYKCSFEIDSSWLIKAASRRQKYLDQSQSINLYLSEPSGKKINDLYMLAWKLGLKSTYYLRTLGATHVEKSTVSDTRLNVVGKSVSDPMSCSIIDPGCEACQ